MKQQNKAQLAVLILVLLGAVFYGGYMFGVQEAEPVENIVVSEDANGIIDADFSLFWDSVKIIKDRFYEPGEVDDQELVYGAIRGVLGALGDPYSTFFEPEDAEKFQQDITGNFGGIGAQIGIRDDQLVVIAPLKGNPAEAAGLKAKDKILQVDDTSTAGLSIDDSVKIIRGEIGTDVRLLMMRDSWDKPREIVITRANIQVPTLDWEIKDGDIAYIQLYSFNSNAPTLFYKASFSALLKGVRGLVLDLRNNSGGFLEVANNISGWFLERGDVIVQEKFPDGTVHKFYANGNGAWRHIPIIVLVNGGSASASEILIGAIRDHLGSTIVGEQTFGKGTVQEIETLADGSKIKISVAEWLTPNGTHIDGEGITPDVEVEFTDEDVENERDPQLERALELIREQTQGMTAIQTIIL